jgi:hypothetical protein
MLKPAQPDETGAASSHTFDADVWSSCGERVCGLRESTSRPLVGGNPFRAVKKAEAVPTNAEQQGSRQLLL